MSVGLLLDDRDAAVVLRGPRKQLLIGQFLKDTNWGALDFLLVDCPPGTSDEHLSIAQLLQKSAALDGALIVTTPQEMALLTEIKFYPPVQDNVRQNLKGYWNETLHLQWLKWLKIHKLLLR